MRKKETFLRERTFGRPYAFKRVTVDVTDAAGNDRSFSMLGLVYSEYASGPSNLLLADAAGEIILDARRVILRSRQKQEC